MAKAPRDCPCFSGKRYAECCGPIHQGTREAATPEARMRSRYSAFALGLGKFLVDTLTSDHPDRELPAAALARELGRQKDTQRFMGLQILHAEGDEVMFYARVFVKGVDCSFVELSTFVNEDGSWRYESGIMIAHENLPPDVTTLRAEDVRMGRATTRRVE